MRKLCARFSPRLLWPYLFLWGVVPMPLYLWAVVWLWLR